MLMLIKYWQAYRNKNIHVDSSPFAPVKKFAKALNAQSSKNVKRSCTYCAKHCRRIYKSHNNDRCFYGDKEGWKEMANLVEWK